MKSYILLVAIVSIGIVALLIGNLPQRQMVKVVPYPVIIEKEVIKLEPYPVEKIVEAPVYPKITPEEYIRLYDRILLGITNHQYYIDHPAEQTWQTGDTEWNQKMVDSYFFMKELYLRAYPSVIETIEVK